MFFNVPDDYVVTDTESIRFVGEVELTGSNYEILATAPTYHETIEAIDMSMMSGD